MISVTRIQTKQWQILKEVRLRALKEAPYAFGTTYAEGLERTEKDWQDMAREHATLPEKAYFMALTAMWVAPEVRGKGVGERIIQAVITWAQAGGATMLEASVSEDNPARTFYQKLGFQETDEREPLRSNPSVQIIMIKRDITPQNRG